jgi:hypothetical protein
MMKPLLISLFAAAVAVAAPARHPSWEPADPQGAAAPAAANLFRNAKVTASGHWDKMRPELAIDGRKDDPGQHWACENLPVWLTVDMGEAKALAALKVWPYWGDGRIYKYKVEGSRDGQAWELLADHAANSIADSAEGDSFTFPAKTVRYVRTTFTDNSRGKASGGHIVEIEGYAALPQAGLKGMIGSTDVRYPRSATPDAKDAPKAINLTAWRGERVNAQLVLWADSTVEQVRIEPAGLVYRGPQSSLLPPLIVQTNFVRYVQAAGKLQPDILDPIQEVTAPGGTSRPVWLTIDVPGNAVPGPYAGKVMVIGANGARIEFPIELEVLSATLPAPQDWQVHLDLWQQPESVARYHGVELWSPEHFALLKPVMQRLADAGQKTITCSLYNEPWGAQTYDWIPGMVEWRKKTDGSWSYDYTIFDRWVSFMSDQVGMKNARIHCYTMVPWSLSFRYYDEATRTQMDAKLRPGTPDYDEYWGRFLKDFVQHLKAKGWLERARIGMDERPDALMRGALATLHKHALGLKVASAINHPSAICSEIDDVSPIINETGGFTPEALAKRRAAGQKTTYYVCCGPGRPNTFTFSPPAEAEWLGLFASAQGYDGFLRWAWNSWVEDPLQSTDFTSWPSGDCFLVYPGNRSSIRFERLRDGLEDFEKIRLLREAAAKAGTPEAKTALADLETAQAPFTWKRGSQAGVHAADVQAANAAIERASRILLK